MALNIYFDRTTLTGGGSSALDDIDGAGLNDGDKAFIYTSADVLYMYILDADSGQGENSPYIISPDLNAGSKRWVLQNLPAQNSGDPVNYTGSFTGFAAAESKTLDIVGVPNNNTVVRNMKLWISNDPGGDYVGHCRLACYSRDTMSEKEELLWQAFFLLTYTEIKTAQWNASGNGGDVDDVNGLTPYDAVRLLGGTAEDTRITAIPDSDTLTVDTITNNHAINTGVVRIAEFPGNFQLQDEDSSNEIHLKLQFFDAPPGATNVNISVNTQ